jgi:hypothetical protein
MGDAPPLIPKYIGEVIEFPDGTAYELVNPLATYRSCHDGTPTEARIVLTCRRDGNGGPSDGEYVMKIKIQCAMLDSVNVWCWLTLRLENSWR